MKLTTSGESHGKGLFAILEGIPAGLFIDVDMINATLKARQSGYGRGDRQKIESDQVEILSGVRGGMTLGSPITLAVWNQDYENWQVCMLPEKADTSLKRLENVRPGHADLSGMLKYGHSDARNILERASARETAVRVAAGEICRQFLSALGIEICGYVRSVKDVVDREEYTFEAIRNCNNELGMMNNELLVRAKSVIDDCRERGDTAGGICELRVRGLKSGFGSCMTYREKLDARLAAAMMSVQAIKGVEIGMGFAAAHSCGSEMHDRIYYNEENSFFRKTNRAGGIEGGMSNGEELVLRAAMKPIPTLMQGLQTVNFNTKQVVTAAAERSDVCAIKACEIVLEAAVVSELCDVVLERLGGDRMSEIIGRYEELPR